MCWGKVGEEVDVWQKNGSGQPRASHPKPPLTFPHQTDLPVEGVRRVLVADEEGDGAAQRGDLVLGDGLESAVAEGAVGKMDECVETLIYFWRCERLTDTPSS